MLWSGGREMAEKEKEKEEEEKEKMTRIKQVISASIYTH